MQTLYVPKYNLHYRVNPRNPRELQWSRKPFGPATQWQHAMSFRNPIRALDLDDETKQGVVVLNDSTTYVGSGVRTWGRKFYPAGTRIYSLYAIGESKMKSRLKIRVHEKVTDGVIHNIPLQKRAIKDMLIELNHDGDNKEYNPKDSIQVNKYVHDTAAVTPEWVLQHLGADKSTQIEDLKQNTNLTPIQIASKLDLLDDPVIWMYYDEPTGTDVILIWKTFLE